MSIVALILIIFYFVASIFSFTPIVASTDESKTNLEDPREKALGEIQSAENAIALANTMIGSLPGEPPNAAKVLLNQAKPHMQNAKNAFDGADYGKAYGLANSAERLARNAIRKLKEIPPGTPYVPPSNVTAEVSVVENSDTTPPAIIDVWTNSITAPQGGVATVYVETTDDLSGVESVGVWLKDPSGVQQAGTSLRWLTWVGVWYDNVSIPQYAQAGTWTIDVEARDATGNSNYVYCAATLEVTQVASADNSPPVIHRVWVDPDNILQGESATVYVDATDDLSGVESVGVWLKDPSGVQNGTINVQSVTSEGILYDSITIPQYASLGTWTIDVGAWDKTGNNCYAYDVATFKVEAALPQTEPVIVPPETPPEEAYTPPAESYTPPAESYTPPVENTQPEAPTPEVAPVDNTPPIIYYACVNPSTIYQGGYANIYVRTTDNMSGVGGVSVWLKDPSGVQSGEMCTLELAQNNVWYGTVAIPQYASLGDWTIDAGVWDTTGNNSYAYDAATFKVGSALLITTITSAPQSVQSGKAIAVEVSVTNNTTNVTASDIQVYSYIGDTTSSTCTVSLAPGGTTRLSLSMTPSGFAPGTYTLGVVAKLQNLESGAKRFVSVV